MNSHKAVKFTKCFSLKSFPLYGMADQPYGYMVCNVPSIPRRILSLGEKEKSGPSDWAMLLWNTVTRKCKGMSSSSTFYLYDADSKVASEVNLYPSKIYGPKMCCLHWCQTFGRISVFEREFPGFCMKPWSPCIACYVTYRRVLHAEDTELLSTMHIEWVLEVSVWVCICMYVCMYVCMFVCNTVFAWSDATFD